MTGKPTLILGEPLPTLVLGNDATPTELRFVFEHVWRTAPEAFGLIVRSLIAEGQRFGSTPEGRDLRERLSRSSALDQLRAVWDEVGARVPDAAQARVLASDPEEYALRNPTLENAAQALARLDSPERDEKPY
jgi:hypothetical protein